ncbi:putative Ig domain-containing protein [Paracraurococcus lichenis]|uniref:Ig domain-containing protein n=1 Tax=Paracraurococcus lichenis TaxID=3064888 RepID=A0ABT9E946_9PROT|nr:putative Ig domain-containing protein [Paracraurococcus sp. LOR1-02]MDO9712727.1 putative Ig domain-containing protein [Paracraurococcus sp. LOR1-02]
MSGTISLPPEALERLVTGLAEGTPAEALAAIRAEIVGQLGGDTDQASVVADRFLHDVAEALARGVRAEEAFASTLRQLQQHMAAEEASAADNGYPLIAALSNGKGAAKAIEAAAGVGPAVKAAFADALAAELAKGDRGICESADGASLACALALGEKAGDAAKAAAAETSVPLTSGAALAATLAAGGDAADAALQALVGHLPQDQAAAMLAAFQAAVSNGSDAGEALALAEQAAVRQAEQTAAAGHGVQADAVAAILAAGGNVTAALAAAGVTGTAAGAALAAALAGGQEMAAAAASAQTAEAAQSSQDAAAASPSAEAALMQALASGENAQQAIAGQGEAFAASLNQALAKGSGLAAALVQASQADLAANSQTHSAGVSSGPSSELLLALATGASLSANGDFAEALNAALASGKDVQTASAAASLAVAELAIQSAAMMAEPADASPVQPSPPSLVAGAMVADLADASPAQPSSPSLVAGAMTEASAAPIAAAPTASPPAASTPVVSAPAVQAPTLTAFDSVLLQSALNTLSPAAGPAPLAPPILLASLSQTLPANTTAPVAVLAPVVPHLNVAPVAGKVAGQAAVQDKPFSFSLPAGAVTDADIAYGDRLTLSATLRDGSPLPAWLSFDPATRAFTGTPGNAGVGPLHILVRGTDKAGLSAVTGFSLDVANVNDAPVVTGPLAAQFGVQDQAFHFVLPAGTFSDPDLAYGDHLSLSATLSNGAPLPNWLSFDAATGTFSGTPGNAEVGSLTIRVTATDSHGLSASSNVGLTVLNVNDAPVLVTAPSNQSATQDQFFTYTLPAGTFSDPDLAHGDHLSLSATLSNGAPLPNWLSFDAATGTFSGTPGNAEVGSLTIRVTATDSHGLSASSNVGLTVLNVNDAPVLVTAPSNQSATQDQFFTYTLPAGTFSDPDLAHGDHLTLSATLSNGSALPSWLSFNAATRTFSGTPANGDVGSVQVRLTATDDAGLTASSNFTLNIANVNDAPIVVSPPPTQSATQDQAFTFTLPAGTFSDPDLAYGDHLSLSATLSNGASLPSWLSFDAATGTFSGTPGNAEVGSLTIRVTATDSYGLSVSSNVGLTVLNVNDAPVLITGPSNQSATQDQSFTYTLPAGMFSDPDLAYGDHLTLSATLSNGSALPSWLSFNAATRTFSGTPANEDVGSVQVRLTATDDAGLTASSNFTLNIANVNDAPIVVSPSPTQSGAQDQAFAFTLPAGTFSDPDLAYGDHLSLSVTLSNGAPLPSWLSFDAATGTFSGTPGNAEVGSLPIQVTATDSYGLSASFKFGLTVLNVNDAPVLVTAPSNQSAAQGQSFTYTLPAGTFSDPDLAYGDHLALSAALSNGSALPSWLSFNAATRTFSGTPANGDVGSVQVRLTATDDAGLTAHSAFTIDVRSTITNVSLSPDAGQTIGYSLAPGHGLVGGLGGAAGYGETILAKADDSFTRVDVAAAFADGFHLGSSTYTGASDFYVGTNGYVTFGTGSSGFNSQGIQAVTLPMVAAQYTDVDTRQGGDIYVDVTSDVVTVTYLNVRAYNTSITTTNSYQIRLHDLGAGDFAIELRYDTLNWGGSSGFATAGWTAGVAGGSDYGEVQGSGTAQFAQNTTFSNVNQPGVYAWEVHAGNIGSAVSVYEHSANGTVVGMLSTTDKESSSSFTYSLLDDADGRFALQTVSGKTQIVVADGAHLDHDQSPSHTVQVETVDSGGNSFVKNLTILVVQQAPSNGFVPTFFSSAAMAAEPTLAQDPAAASLQDGGAYRMLVEAATGSVTAAHTSTEVQSPGEFNISSTSLPNHAAVLPDAESHSHPVVQDHSVDQLHA